MEASDSRVRPYLLYILVFSPFAAFTLLMISKVIPYFTFEYAVNFLSTKTDEVLHTPAFMWAFYIHISTSAVVLLAGLPQFLTTLVKQLPLLHRYSGRVYVFTILALAGPSGFVLALYANGGLPAKVGFSLQCIVWWYVTYMAYHHVRQKNYRLHIDWMVRSYAITLAALSLRTEGYLMHYFFQTKPIETYVTITWLSWVGNWLIAEILLSAGLGNYLFTKYTQK